MTSITTSKSYQDESDVGSSYKPKSVAKSVVIQRTSGVGRNRSSGQGFGGGYGGGFSFSGQRSSMVFNPTVYSQMAGTGIAGFRDTREKEKKDIQDCNTRLASYIEKVRWLEAQNKKLEAENEALRNRKQEDWKPIRDMYETELKQCQTVIADLSTQKGVSEAKLAGLQDEIQSLKEIMATHENNSKDYCKKIDQLNSQIGEFEGELTTLRLRCGSLEDEIAKLRALLNKYKDENARLRADLDAETAAHIEQEVLAQTKTEEVEFLQDLLDKLNLIQQEPVTIKGMDMEAFFKGQLRQAVSEIQQAYEDQCQQLTMDMESKYASQVNQLKSGTVRDTMEAEHAKSEVKRLRDQLAEKNSRLAELESLFATLKAERDNLMVSLSEAKMELESVRADLSGKLLESQSQVEGLLEQIQTLIDMKLNLELEISCYRKLLEGEENRGGLRQLVEQTIGIQSVGAGQLSDIIGQSSIGMGGGFGGSSGSSTSRFTVQRSSKGAVGFQNADASGSSIVLENTSSGSRSVTQALKGWRLIKKANGKEVCNIELPARDIRPGQTFTIYAKGAKSSTNLENEFIADPFSFGVGQCDIFLLDESGAEKAKLMMKETR